MFERRLEISEGKLRGYLGEEPSRQREYLSTGAHPGLSLVYLRSSRETDVAEWGKQRRLGGVGLVAPVKTLAFAQNGMPLECFEQRT